MKRAVRPFFRRPYLVPIVLLLLIAIPAFPAAASQPRPEIGSYPYAPGEVLIAWQPDSSGLPKGAPPQRTGTGRSSADQQTVVQTLEARTGLTVLEAEPYYGMGRLSVPPGQEQAEIIRLSALPWIQSAELNYIAHAADTYPNDPDIGRQWNMRRIYAPAAWDLTTGSSSINVAVVDTGIDYTHPEFAGRRRPGWDYVGTDGSSPRDDNGHGTHVAGILAAGANNGMGVAGLASNIRIVPLKVLDSTGAGSVYDVALAIYDAVDLFGAQIINLSLQILANPNDPNALTVLQNAVSYAANTKGRLLVAAAGNCAEGGVNCNFIVNPTIYPAAFGDVLSVAASDHYDEWASYSGHMSYVDLAAPGGIPADQIWSTWPTSSYGYDYGTSMAAPLASAAAALVWTLRPGAPRLEITDILKQSADKVGGIPYDCCDYLGRTRNDYFGYGRLNIGKAVRLAYPPSLSPDPGGTQAFLMGGALQQANGRVSLMNPSDQPLQWTADVTQGADWLHLSTSSGAASFSAPGNLSFMVGPALPPPGQYPGLVRVTYNAGASGFDIPMQLQVVDPIHLAFLPQATDGSLAASWYDPLPGGQALALSNNSLARVSLPFPISYYGGVYASSIWVSDNGIALFAEDAAAGDFKPANCMPVAARPNNALYVLWHDWRPDLGGQVFVHQPDNDTFVVTWYQVVRSGSPIPHSFQLVLTRDGRVLYQYQSVASPLEGTIGIENYDGTLAQPVLCNGAGRQVRSGDALLMHPSLPW